MSEVPSLKPRVSVFVPVYNDEHTVKDVIEKSIETLRETASEYEIIIVNDGSPDKAGAIADELSQKYLGVVKVIHHGHNKGYGAALRTGFSACKHEWICAVDGDDEYDIRDLKKLIKHIGRYDLIVTFRYVKLYSTFRVFISGVYNKLLRWIFKTPFRDISSGLRLVRKDVLEDISLIVDSPFIGAELAIKAMLKGYRVGEVGIQTFPRKFGKGSATSWKNIYATIVDMIYIRKIIFSKKYDG